MADDACVFNFNLAEYVDSSASENQIKSRQTERVKLVNEFQGTHGSLDDQIFTIVVSRYHQSITEKLLTGAVKTLGREGVQDDQINVLYVPGTWEIPLAAKMALRSQAPAAVICLGCVIRGETTHDQYINMTVSSELGRLGIEYEVPIAFGVLTCNTLDQAIQRAGGDVGNKGVEAAEAVIEMVRLRREIGSADPQTH